jgi:hypothetical protein
MLHPFPCNTGRSWVLGKAACDVGCHDIVGEDLAALVLYLCVSTRSK